MLEDEAKRDPEKYNAWYNTFSHFLKEGTQVDYENKDALFRLLRFNVNYTENKSTLISLDDYIGKMVPNQKKIYFAFGATYDAAMSSPFYEPFKGKDVPVLVLTHQLDEFCLTAAQDHKGMRFVNIEQTQIDEIRKDLGIEVGNQNVESRLPEDDVTNFSLWLKDTLSSKVGRVQLSKRLTSTPAILVGQMSSSMYMMMQML